MVGMTRKLPAPAVVALSAAALGATLLLVGGCAGVPAEPAPTWTGEARPTPTWTGEARPTPIGDGPPNHADNNGWKQRHDLSPDDQRLAGQAADRIRPELAKLRTAGDFAPDSTRRMLLNLGYPSGDVEVTPMRTPGGWSSPQPPAGAVFAVHLGRAACVLGDVRPERVLVEVRGSATEYGCLEPFSH
jgi:hypothetical protein